MTALGRFQQMAWEPIHPLCQPQSSIIYLACYVNEKRYHRAIYLHFVSMPARCSAFTVGTRTRYFVFSGVGSMAVASGSPKVYWNLYSTYYPSVGCPETGHSLISNLKKGAGLENTPMTHHLLICKFMGRFMFFRRSLRPDR